MKQKLVKCAPRAYFELIRSDIPRSSCARHARLPFLRSSPLSVMKSFVPKSSSPSVSEPHYCEAYTGRASIPHGDAGKEEEERETETSELARGLPSYSGQDPKGGGLSLAFVRRQGWRLFGGGGGRMSPYLGLDSHVAGCRSPSYSAGQGDGESRSL